MRSSASSPSLDLCPPSSLGVLTRALLVQPRRGGGACQLREKVLAEAATHFIIVADSRKDSKILGHAWKQGVPIEVAPFAWAKVFVSASRSLPRSSSPRRSCDETLIAGVVRVRRPAEDGLREPGAAHGQDEGRPGRHRQRVRPPLSPSLLSLESSTLTHSLNCSNFVIDAVFSESYMRDPAELLHRIKMCVLLPLPSGSLAHEGPRTDAECTCAGSRASSRSASSSAWPRRRTLATRTARCSRGGRTVRPLSSLSLFLSLH